MNICSIFGHFWNFLRPNLSNWKIWTWQPCRTTQFSKSFSEIWLICDHDLFTYHLLSSAIFFRSIYFFVQYIFFCSFPFLLTKDLHSDWKFRTFVKNVINDYKFVNFDSKLVNNLAKKLLYDTFNGFFSSKLSKFLLFQH